MMTFNAHLAMPAGDRTFRSRPRPFRRSRAARDTRTFGCTRREASDRCGSRATTHLRRDVALKELKPDQTSSGAARARFLREAQITGQLEHPGIVPVYELAQRTLDQQHFYTMRFVNGRTLNQATRAYHDRRAAGQSDSLEFLRLLGALVAICNTVAYAHSRGVIHRDLKGQNVVLGKFGEVVLLDWGLAKLLDSPGGEGTPPRLVRFGSNRTHRT